MPNKDIKKRREAYKRWYQKHGKDKVVADKKQARYIAKKVNKERQICSIRGCTMLGERHHEDYRAREDIIWLCKKHHEAVHSEKKCSMCDKPHKALGLCYNHWRQQRRKMYGQNLYR